MTIANKIFILILLFFSGSIFSDTDNSVTSVDIIERNNYLEFSTASIEKNIDLSGFKGLLTFDDGPHPATTPSIVRALQEAKIKKVIFYFVGYRIIEYPDLVRLVYNAGYDIGYHSMFHQNQAKMSRYDITKDIKNFKIALNSALNVNYPLKYARPPYGGMTNISVRKFFQLENNNKLHKLKLGKKFNKLIVKSSIIQSYRKQNLEISLWNIDFDDWVKPIDLLYARSKYIKSIKQVWLFHEMPVYNKNYKIYKNNIEIDFPYFLRLLDEIY